MAVFNFYLARTRNFHFGFFTNQFLEGKTPPDRGRHFLVSAILPYFLVLLLAGALMVLTLASVGLQTLADTGSYWLGDARWFTTLT